MPHIGRKRYAVVSCHVERLLDDHAWERLARLQARRPGGFVVAALVRPPDPAAGEDEERWLERARAAAAAGPFGLHTHWTSPTHARPTRGEPAERVRREVAWLRERRLEPRFFAGGGWYTDDRVRRALGELGLVDCTATAFRPRFLEPGAPHLRLRQPAEVDGATILPATHSLGMLARGLLRPLPTYVHVYFHDTDLVSGARRAALTASLRLLALRCEPRDLDAAAAAVRA